MSEAEEFDAYPAYYAGAEVAGLPLEDIDGSGEREVRGLGQRSAVWTFIYGDCDPPKGEGGCSTPLQIQNWSTCRRWFSLFFRKRGLYDLRGAKATGGGGSIESSPLEIFTGRTTVVIFAHERNIAKSAARQLLEIGQAEPPMLLSPPAPGSLQGKLPCQRPWW